jgi:hypothetical protein
VRNEEECVYSVCLFRCNIFIGFRIIKEVPGLVGSGTPCRRFIRICLHKLNKILTSDNLIRQIALLYCTRTYTLLRQKT